jgi:hypothetical protein
MFDADQDDDADDDDADDQDEDERTVGDILTPIRNLVASALDAINRGNLGEAARTLHELKAAFGDDDEEDDDEEKDEPTTNDDEELADDLEGDEPKITNRTPIVDGERGRCGSCNRNYEVAKRIIARTKSHIFSRCPRCGHNEAFAVMAVEVME